MLSRVLGVETQGQGDSREMVRKSQDLNAGCQFSLTPLRPTVSEDGRYRVLIDFPDSSGHEVVQVEHQTVLLRELS